MTFKVRPATTVPSTMTTSDRLLSPSKSVYELKKKGGVFNKKKKKGGCLYKKYITPPGGFEPPYTGFKGQRTTDWANESNIGLSRGDTRHLLPSKSTQKRLPGGHTFPVDSRRDTFKCISTFRQIDVVIRQIGCSNPDFNVFRDCTCLFFIGWFLNVSWFIWRSCWGTFSDCHFDFENCIL